MIRVFVRDVSHLLALVVGFAAGICFLPNLSAAGEPSLSEVRSHAVGVLYTADFTRVRKGGDLRHRGEGAVTIGPSADALLGEIAPGPAHKLYLTPEFVEAEAGFQSVKSRSLVLGDIKTFKNFIVDDGSGIDRSAYHSAVISREAFSEFVTAAKVRST